MLWLNFSTSETDLVVCSLLKKGPGWGGQLSCLLAAKDRPPKWRVPLDSWEGERGMGGSQVIMGMVEGLWDQAEGLEGASWGSLPNSSCS